MADNPAPTRSKGIADNSTASQTTQYNKFPQEAATNEWIYQSLIKQCQLEYDMAWRVLNSKLSTWLVRLRVYNNQKRDTGVVGDPLLFTYMQAILASVYENKLMVRFKGTNDEDEDIAEALTGVAKSDYIDMLKEELDYDLDWDTLFFGNGYILLTEFDRKLNLPKPEIVDPTIMLRDPRAKRINGEYLTGKNSARFWGIAELWTRDEMEKNGNFFNLNDLRLGRSQTNSLIYDARQAREDAQGRNQLLKYEEKDLGANAQYELLRWFTHWKDPRDGKVKKVMVYLGNDRNKICRFKILDNQEYWPVTQRSIFPTSHDWDGTSVPDIVEDKQRLRAIMLNLGVNMGKASLYPMYLYDKQKITNRGDLKFDFNKFIGVENNNGAALDNALRPVQKAQFDPNLFNMIMQTLDMSAQRALSTPEVKQGVPQKNERSATEVNKMAQGSDVRYSLTYKIFSWSEKEFWYQWYNMYREYMTPLDEKVIEVEGFTYGAKFLTYKKKDIIAKRDPRIFVEDTNVADQQRNTNRILFNEFGALAANYPGTNIRFLMKHSGKLHGLGKADMDRLFPPTPDELKARRENGDLNKNKQVHVDPNDNDQEHLEEHMKAADTPAKRAHVRTHIEAMELKKTHPEMFPQQQQQTPPGGQGVGSPPNPGQQQQMQGQNPNAGLAQAFKPKGNSPARRAAKQTRPGMIKSNG